MNSMAERLQLIIDQSKFNKTEFAREIKVTQGFISQVCAGKSNLSQRTIDMICQKFDVNKNWLENGTGEMYRNISRVEEISAFIGRILGDGDAEFQRGFVAALAKLSVEEWSVLEKIAKNAAGIIDKEET